MSIYEHLIAEAEICEKMARTDGSVKEQKEWKKRARFYRRQAKELKPEVALREWRGEF